MFDPSPTAPTTIGGIKSLATRIQRADGHQYSKALDAASRSAGFRNFAHARGQLIGSAEPSSAGVPLFITFYWRDIDSGLKGRETLTIHLSRPWGKFLTVSQFKHSRHLYDLSPRAPDHVEGMTLAPSQERARSLVCAAARTFMFMDATGLRPSGGHSRAYPRGESKNRIPHSDHPSTWFDPVGRGYLYVDEPYQAAVAGQKEIDERAMWALSMLYVISQPSWPGMYSPGQEAGTGSQIYLVNHVLNGVDLPAVTAALNALPAPPLASSWTGESASFPPLFSSPRQGEPLDVPEPSASRKASVVVNAHVPQRAPLSVHREVGSLLTRIASTARYRAGVRKNLGDISSMLDHKVAEEYEDDELGNEELVQLYYGEPSVDWFKHPTLEQRAHLLDEMQKLKSLLLQHFRHFHLLVDVLRKYKAAERSLQRWV